MLEISHKQDVLIPFEQIGESGWRENTQLILETYADLWEEDLPEPVTEKEIAETEQRLNAKLPEGLKTFYLTFGVANIGELLLPLEDMIWSKELWENNPYAPDFTEEDKAILPHLIVFGEYLGNGNMFCFHCETHEIYYYDHDDRPYISKLFDKIDDYLKGCLVGLQAELPDDDTDQEELEDWVGEKLNTLFGEKVIWKWRY